MDGISDISTISQSMTHRIFIKKCQVCFAVKVAVYGIRRTSYTYRSKTIEFLSSFVEWFIRIYCCSEWVDEFSHDLVVCSVLHQKKRNHKRMTTNGKPYNWKRFFSIFSRLLSSSATFRHSHYFYWTTDVHHTRNRMKTIIILRNRLIFFSSRCCSRIRHNFICCCLSYAVSLLVTVDSFNVFDRICKFFCD